MTLLEAKRIVRATGYTVFREENEEKDDFDRAWDSLCASVTTMGEKLKGEVRALVVNYMGDEDQEVWYNEVLGDNGFDFGHELSRKEKQDPQYKELKKAIRITLRRFQRKVEKLLESSEAYRLGDDLSSDLYIDTMEEIGLPLLREYD